MTDTAPLLTQSDPLDTVKRALECAAAALPAVRQQHNYLVEARCKQDIELAELRTRAREFNTALSDTIRRIRDALMAPPEEPTQACVERRMDELKEIRAELKQVHAKLDGLRVEYNSSVATVHAVRKTLAAFPEEAIQACAERRMEELKLANEVIAEKQRIIERFLESEKKAEAEVARLKAELETATYVLKNYETHTERAQRRLSGYPGALGKNYLAAALDVVDFERTRAGLVEADRDKTLKELESLRIRIIGELTDAGAFLPVGADPLAPDEVRSAVRSAVRHERICGLRLKITLAWQLYCDDTAGGADARDFWHELPPNVKKIYLGRADTLAEGVNHV